MYGGYSVAGLTRQFVALKTVSSNLTTHPTEYVLHSAERIFYACVYPLNCRGDLLSPVFYSHQFHHTPKSYYLIANKIQVKSQQQGSHSVGANSVRPSKPQTCCQSTLPNAFHKPCREAPTCHKTEKGRQLKSCRPDPEVIYFIKRNFCCKQPQIS